MGTGQSTTTSKAVWPPPRTPSFSFAQLQRALERNIGFSWTQIRQLHQRFLKLSRHQPTIRPENFDTIQDLDLNPIRSRIIRAFFDNRNLHKGTSGLAEEINFEEFLTIIAYFRPMGSYLNPVEAELYLKEKIRFLFHMYDEDCDGLITQQEYQKVVEDLLSGSPDVEKEWVSSVASSIAHGALKEAARVSDEPQGKGERYPGINFDDFLKTWRGIDVAVKMQLSFLNTESTTT